MDTCRGVLVYDGACGFCATSARWIRGKWSDDEGPVAIPWQDLTPEFVKASLLGDVQFQLAAWWIDSERKESGFRAVARALLEAKRPWSSLGRLLLTPPVSWVAPLGYRVVARYRYRLPGATPTCKTT